MINQDYIKTLDCGIRGVEWWEININYPLIAEMILITFPDYIDDFYFDIKVHMLMPNQFPCIPNWHRDFVPRSNNKPDLSLIKPEYPLYLWLSNPPLTQFKDGREVKPQEWIRFTQEDLHRGSESTEHIWRLFIRASHKEITPEHNKRLGKVRHSQVYLDSVNFTW